MGAVFMSYQYCRVICTPVRNYKKISVLIKTWCKLDREGCRTVFMFPSTGFNEKENECFVAFTAYCCVGYSTCVIWSC